MKHVDGSWTTQDDQQCADLLSRHRDEPYDQALDTPIRYVPTRPAAWPDGWGQQSPQWVDVASLLVAGCAVALSLMCIWWLIS